MVITKKVKIGDKEVEVKTLTVADMMKISGDQITGFHNILMAVLKEEDKEYLESLDYDFKLNKDIEELIKAFVEVNPRLNKTQTQDFLSQTPQSSNGGK